MLLKKQNRKLTLGNISRDIIRVGLVSMQWKLDAPNVDYKINGQMSSTSSNLSLCLVAMLAHAQVQYFLI